MRSLPFQLTAGALLSAILAVGMANAEQDPNISQVQFEDGGPVDPIDRKQDAGKSQAAPLDMQSLPANIFGNVDQLNLLPPERRNQALSPAADAVFGAEATGRVSNDLGDLLNKSISSHGVSTQQRTPIVTDTRVRGQRVGQVLASGSYWFPARMDLDTMMNKIDSRLLDNLILIKGPYSSRYGPGFRFVDFDLIQTPRYQNGFQAHGSTSFDYDTNGEQSYGRQTVWAGSDNWGARVSYGHRTGSDYQAGDGRDIPASYKSRDWFVALGWDSSPSSHWEFNYLRLDQTDLDFPGLVYDINFLVTDGYEIKYVNTNPVVGDRIDAEVWYNRTRFAGDSQGSAEAAALLTGGFATTDADASSLGYRTETTFVHNDYVQTSVGFDVLHLRQSLNDIETSLPSNDNNFPIPPSTSTDIGVFIEEVYAPTQWLTCTVGGRLDYISNNADNVVPGVDGTISDLFDGAGLAQEYKLWSAYVTADARLNENWTGTAGFGFGQRPPTLTELYVSGSFIGSLQRGLTFLFGDPLLEQEKTRQVDLGLRANYERSRFGLHGYFSWVDDYITYDLYTPAGGGFGGFPEGASFVNTEAIIAGFEAYGEGDITPMLSAFGTMAYTEGRDLTRNTPARDNPGGDRSGVAGRPHESLPGITPLETRVGLLLHDPSPSRAWGIEFAARIVDNQDRIAASLQEVETPGFTTYDIRTYLRKENWSFTSGVENLTDKFYIEHLDYRTGTGVFRPGISFYSGAEVTY